MGESPGKLVLIMGPSGVGKSVILQELREKHPEFVFPRSATTRKRREGEGDDLYHFISNDEFDQLMAEEKLLEWAIVHEGARYGTMVDEIIPHIEEGKVVVREVDVQGFESIRSHSLFSGDEAPYPLQSIFILPESEDQLVSHITSRAPIGEEELKRRIASMEKELTFAELCSVQVTNIEGKLEDAIRHIEEAIHSSV